jgi:predicted O-methyltransferase YrrM
MGSSQETEYLWQDSTTLGDAVEGQLYKADRQLLYSTIIEEKPNIVLEVGTWHGGGSTLSIAKALKENGKGTLYTIEMMRNFFDSAVSSYKKEKPELLPYIEFLYGNSLTEYPPLLRDLTVELKASRVVDIVFLDGCGTKSKGGHTSTLAELKMFEPFMKKNGILMMHDWFDAKAELARPYIIKSKKWKVIKELKKPDSIGFGKVAYVG